MSIPSCTKFLAVFGTHFKNYPRIPRYFLVDFDFIASSLQEFSKIDEMENDNFRDIKKNPFHTEFYGIFRKS